MSTDDDDPATMVPEGSTGASSTVPPRKTPYYQKTFWAWSVQAALGSEQGKATAADYQQIAPPGSRMFVAAVDE
jgi:hypothetical protein